MAARSSSHTPSGTAEGNLDRKVMTPLFGILAIDMMGVGVVLPLLPFYAQHFGADAFTIGLLVAAFSFCQFVAAPLLGRWSDRHGRRTLLAVSQLGTMAGLALLALAPNLVVVFVARIIGGLTAGNMSVASALAVDHSSPAIRKQAIGVISAGAGVGLMSGPALSALFAGLSLSAPIWAACGLSGMSAIATLVLLPKGPPRQTTAAPKATGSLWASGIMPILAAMLAFFLAFAMFTSELAVVAHAQVLWQDRPLGPRAIGWLFTIAGTINIAVQFFVMRKVSSLMSDRSLSICGFVVLIFAFVLLRSATTFSVLVLAVVFIALSSAFLRPVLTAMLTLAAPPAGQGALMGLASSLMAGANIVGPVIAGTLIAREMVGTWAAIMSCLCALGAVMAMVSGKMRISELT